MKYVLKVKERTSRLSLTARTDNKATLTFSGRAVATQAKRVTPGDSEQRITGDDGYFLSEVIVDPIPSYYGHIAYNGGVITVY